MIDDRLAAALAAHPIDGPPCVTANVLAAMFEVSEPEFAGLVGELPPSVLIAGNQVWAIEDLRLWLRRHEPLWDEGDADEADWFPHGPAIERMESDDFVDAAPYLVSLRDPGPRFLTRAELIELDRKYGPAMRAMIAKIDGGPRV